MSAAALTGPEIVYPDDDGEPMSDNTVQFNWIVLIKTNLDAMFRDSPDVFVAGNHLIYPVEGDLATRQAPDVYVAFGRPRHDRGSYQVWNEGGVFPHVIFEVLSPSNHEPAMKDKRTFYRRHGAEEYYEIDPARDTLRAFASGPAGRLRKVKDVAGFTSPRLGIRFAHGPDGWRLFRPDGTPFRTQAELEAENTGLRTENAGLSAENAGLMARVAAERERAEAADARAAWFRELLKQAGIDPEGGE